MSQSGSSFATAAGGQQRLDDQGNVDLNTPVRAFNRSEAPVTWLYARQKYVLQPEIPSYVPYMAMVHWQGDPRAIDVPGGKLHEQYRREWRERLTVLYGVYENTHLWDQIPLVECYPIDSDIRFETVLLDPDGTALSPEVAAASETEFLRRQLAQMQEQMRILSSQINLNESQDAATAAAGLDPEDLERQATNIKSQAPESLMGAAPAPRDRGPVAKKIAAKGVTRDA